MELRASADSLDGAEKQVTASRSPAALRQELALLQAHKEAKRQANQATETAVEQSKPLTWDTMKDLSSWNAIKAVETKQQQQQQQQQQQHHHLQRSQQRHHHQHHQSRAINNRETKPPLSWDEMKNLSWDTIKAAEAQQQRTRDHVS